MLQQHQYHATCMATVSEELYTSSLHRVLMIMTHEGLKALQGLQLKAQEDRHRHKVARVSGTDCCEYCCSELSRVAATDRVSLPFVAKLVKASFPMAFGRVGGYSFLGSSQQQLQWQLQL